jgi:hypothetical protein
MPEDKTDKLERRARLSAALRENLKRRKAQARRRGAGMGGAERAPADPKTAGYSKE